MKKGPARVPIETRFWLYVARGADHECWEWTGGKSHGYGVLALPGHAAPKVRAARYSYELHCGPIPDGLVIDHLCENKGCVNPWHLEPVTSEVNLQRHFGKRQECLRGHPLEWRRDTYKDGTPRLRRFCRTCSTERNKRQPKEEIHA
jgi:hypothetical protein